MALDELWCINTPLLVYIMFVNIKCLARKKKDIFHSFVRLTVLITKVKQNANEGMGIWGNDLDIRTPSLKGC